VGASFCLDFLNLFYQEKRLAEKPENFRKTATMIQKSPKAT